jgi:tyrosyl-tRNA synthetase
MSKTYGNYVGVTEPAEEMFGKLMSIPDEVMGQYYLLLLDEDLDPERHPGDAKRELARRICDRFHGPGAGEAAEQQFDRIHVERGVPQEIPSADLAAHLSGGDGGLIHLPALIADEFSLSRSEARRLIEQGGVRLDGEQVDPGRLDLAANELEGRVLQVGKRRFARLVAGSTGSVSGARARGPRSSG